ncbi:MAG: thioredoxin family protein [Bacteroidales bacterium]|nr:thioredoxin family protein [Bacteroidales bacterium]
MKKLVYKFSFLILLATLSLNITSCNGPAKDDSNKKILTENTIENNDLKVYYFHASRRCETCVAVENVTRSAIKEYYGDKVVFESLDVEEESNKALVEKYNISFQTLLIIKGDKKVDLTNEAFLNAITNPDQLKSLLKSNIDSLM